MLFRFWYWMTTLKPYLLISYHYPREYQFLGSIQNPARTSHFLAVTPIVDHYKPGIVPCRTVFFYGGARWDHDLHVMSLKHAKQKWTDTHTHSHIFYRFLIGHGNFELRRKLYLPVNGEDRFWEFLADDVQICS